MPENPIQRGRNPLRAPNRATRAPPAEPAVPSNFGQATLWPRPAASENEPVKTALAEALQARGYDSLTPVQEAVGAPELANADLLVSAQTGSGKTVGFGIAMAPTLLGDGEGFERAAAPLALVIAPTRELALQVKRELGWLYQGAGAVMASTVGGMDMRDERRSLERGTHIVVATPGRLRDHIMRGSIDLSQIRAVVLDEADEMLDLGFREDLEFILSQAPESRRTLMFSATVPTGIARLAETYLKDHQRIKTVSEKSQHADIEYQMLAVSQRDAENAIINVLRYHEAPNAIVFCNTRAVVNRLTTRLSNRGFPVVALSGELSQAERSNALQSLRDGRARVCVATDVAARGIDLPKLDLVVHADLPSNHETLLHRSGRTGRAGRKGVSALIVPGKARGKAMRLLRSAKIIAEEANAPSADDVRARDEERMLSDAAWSTEISESEATPVAKLVESFAPEKLAAAYLRLYHSHHTAPEELGDPGKDVRERKERAPFGPSVWFSVSGGRDAGAEPRRLLPMLCKAGNLTKDDIGAIRVQSGESFVELRESSAAAFLSVLGGNLEIEPGAKVSKLDKAPDIANSPRPKFEGNGPRRDRDDRKPRGDFKPREDRKPREGYKSREERKPRDDYKSRDDFKPREDRKPRPDRDERASKPAYKKPSSSAPIDWNDDPAPRSKKPKSDAKAAPKRASDPSARLERPGGGFVRPLKTRGAGGKGGDARPYAGKGKPSDKPKGPPPPKGKSNSKKNKARAATSKGGSGAPKRPNRKG